jgi:hypothetical protein
MNDNVEVRIQIEHSESVFQIPGSIFYEHELHSLIRAFLMPTLKEMVRNQKRYKAWQKSS